MENLTETEMEEFDLIIVGAGFFGLATAKTYLQVNPTARVLVLDSQNSVGGTWASERLYKNLVSNNIAGNFQLLDFPLLTKEWGIADEKYNPGIVVHQYLTAYAHKFDFFERIRFSCFVESAELQEDDTWVLTYSKGIESTKVKCAKLVLATGTTFKPRVPAFEGLDLFKGKVFHTKELANSAKLMENAKHITVIGGSKSAYDTVYLSAQTGKRVHWVIRGSGRGPSWVAPSWVSPFKLSSEKLSLTRFMSWFIPSPYDDGGFRIARWFLQNTWLGLKLNAALWYIMETEMTTASAYNSHPETQKLLPSQHMFWSGTQAGVWNYPTDFMELIRNGTVEVHVSDVSKVSEGTVDLVNGDEITTDLLICATGWHTTPTIRFSPASLSTKIGPVAHDTKSPQIQKIDKDIKRRNPILAQQPTAGPSTDMEGASYELYRGIVPPSFAKSRNFAWMGMTVSLSGMITAGIQALWLTAFLDDQLANDPIHAGKTEADISDETLWFTRFWRWRAPLGLGPTMPDMVVETLTYYDVLLQDLAIENRRKNGWREWFQTYGAKDYNGIVDEWLGKNTGKKMYGKEKTA